MDRSRLRNVMAAIWRLTSTESRTYSQPSNELWVVSGRFVGSSKPPRTRLLEGMERIVDIRCDIARHARVKSMPPVEVVPYVWRDAGGLILGKTTHLDVGTDTYLRVAFRLRPPSVAMPPPSALSSFMNLRTVSTL